jgi:flavodoxin
MCVRILIVYFTQTKNTEKVAKGIYEELLTQGHEVHLEKIEGITPDILDDYNLVFMGSACHDADLAQPVKQFLDGISHSPPYKMAGFVTHATYTDEGGNRERELYDKWAGKCIKSFNQVSQEKNIDFLGYFHCQGVPTPEIGDFIHRVIVTDEDEWNKYKEEVNKHPNEEDIQRAKEFAHNVLLKFRRLAA